MEQKKREWTKKEEEYLKKWYGKKSVKEIAKKLNRTYDSVQRKAQRMKLTSSALASEHRAWTDEEVEYLLRYYSNKGVDFIAKKLDRTEESIKHKAYTLGLNAYICGNEKLYVRTFANCFNCDSSVINRWIEKYDLQYSIVQRGQLKCKLINVKVFWKWAENHKDIIPWHKYEPYSLLPEPKWLRETILEYGVKNKNNRKKITPMTRIMVYNMYRRGQTFEEIANELHRSVESVKHIYKEENKNASKRHASK